MKHALIVLLFTLTAAPVSAVDVHYTPEEKKQCEAEGGCGVYSALFMKSMAAHFYEKGVEDGASECKAKKQAKLPINLATF